MHSFAARGLRRAQQAGKQAREYCKQTIANEEDKKILGWEDLDRIRKAQQQQWHGRHRTGYTWLAQPGDMITSIYIPSAIAVAVIYYWVEAWNILSEPWSEHPNFLK